MIRSDNNNLFYYCCFSMFLCHRLLICVCHISLRLCLMTTWDTRIMSCYLFMFSIFVCFACTGSRFMFVIGPSIARTYSVRHCKLLSFDKHINFICSLANKGHFIVIYWPRLTRFREMAALFSSSTPPGLLMGCSWNHQGGLTPV